MKTMIAAYNPQMGHPSTPRGFILGGQRKNASLLSMTFNLQTDGEETRGHVIALIGRKKIEMFHDFIVGWMCGIEDAAQPPGANNDKPAVIRHKFHLDDNFGRVFQSLKDGGALTASISAKIEMQQIPDTVRGTSGLAPVIFYFVYGGDNWSRAEAFMQRTVQLSGMPGTFQQLQEDPDPEEIAAGAPPL